MSDNGDLFKAIIRTQITNQSTANCTKLMSVPEQPIDNNTPTYYNHEAANAPYAQLHIVITGCHIDEDCSTQAACYLPYSVINNLTW